ncbi:short-chain dehydrogenase [Veronia pacifica]|uniref:Short-chain dehydrogenase n=1 Tax=Veronia pacifica TaxID=1080227 RepID=A0A1C3EQT9_9GAMM|nr:short-chain dehydrogenase [Veronia pacifica]
MTTVFITGANRGIGLTLVRECLNKGYQVLATYRSKESTQALITLDQQMSKLSLFQLDVTDYQAARELADVLPPIDILINNAGYFGPKGVGFGDTDPVEWRRVLEVNTIAPQMLVEALYPKLLAGHDRKIVCLSSKVGSMTENTSGGGYLYRSSKAALNSVVKSLSNDLAPEGFTVLALHPGWVKTEMGGPNALITAEESVDGLLSVILESNTDKSGRFIDFRGDELPW